jgi:hypothetical protein
MLLLAAADTTKSALDRLKEVPPAFWLKVGIAVVAVIVVVLVLRKLAQMNKVVLAAVILIVGSAIGFNWVYERNEPAWATPVVEKLAQILPSKGAYQAKQAK